MPREDSFDLCTSLRRCRLVRPCAWLRPDARPSAQSGSQAHPWIDQSILAAAKAEGSLIVYSSTNEQEGLPLLKMFEDATGIKVQYVRAADSPLMSRVAIEYRAGQKAWDIIQTTTLNKMPPQMLAQIDLPEAKNISRRRAIPAGAGTASTPTTIAGLQHRMVKASDLPKTYEEFAKHTEWAGKVAIEGTDNEWLKALLRILRRGEGHGAGQGDRRPISSRC